jgi:hypothetical protein
MTKEQEKQMIAMWSVWLFIAMLCVAGVVKIAQIIWENI